MKSNKEYLYEYKSDSVGLAKIIQDTKKKQKEEDILDFLKKIRHIPLFWVIDNEELKEVYEAIDEIRDFYQNELKEVKIKK